MAAHGLSAREEEVAKLLLERKLPVEQAAVLWKCTGGHPALLYELIRRGISEPAQATEAVKYYISMTCKLSRHLSDPQACEVMRRLLRGETVASLEDPCIRHEPGLYAESRLYFDGLLRWNRLGKTEFRCSAVPLLLANALER